MARGPSAQERRAARRALDQRYEGLRPLVALTALPRGGWVRAVREALGMTTSDLGTRMGVSSTSVLGLEANERAGKAGLDTLRRAADALDCDLVYVLVPKRPLTALVEDRARTVAQKMIGSVEHSMLLEDQQVAAPTAREQLDELAHRVQDQPGLWRDA